MRLGLRQANQAFARAIRVVRSGREVVLTDRGRPLAVIRPITNSEDDASARLAALAAEGLLRPAEISTPMPRPRWRPAAIRGESIVDAIRRDRDENV